MKEIIPNNEKSFNILNKLILNGFYEGKITSNRIEFSRKYGLLNSSSNYQIIGVLNNENKFELGFKFKPPIDVLAKIAIGLGVFFSIISLINNGNWILPILFLIIPFIVIYIDFRLKKKEINIFISKFLELYKSEYEN